MSFDRFREIVYADAEFKADKGERQGPICLVAHERRSGRKFLVWEDDLLKMKEPPFATGKDVLFVAYYASAEFGCYLPLEWQLPENTLDLYTEFRVLTNGLNPPRGNGLLGALAHFDLPSINAREKEDMRELALRGGPWTRDEREALLAYCESDVKVLPELFERMSSSIDLNRALLRGRYMTAVAQMEFNGIPIDTRALSILREYWDGIIEQLIEKIDADYGVYEGQTFKAERFARLLGRNNIPWPRLDSGALDLSQNAFKEMARSYQVLMPLKELRYTLGQLRLNDLAVGSDSRNRTMLSAFRAKTGRNLPSSSRYIYGPSTWIRSLIRPKPGCGVAYIDWGQQEWAIAAVLSGDEKMIAAYSSGDPYLAFAIQAGAAPHHATKKSHREVREQFKQCALAVNYGMGPVSLAYRLNQPVRKARDLLDLHKHTYRDFWQWSDGIVDYAALHRELWTVFGWKLSLNGKFNHRSLRNFPVQGNGAEMLRLACILGLARGVKICAPVHDAVLIEAPVEELQERVSTMRQAMAGASAMVLDGFRLRTDVAVFQYPDRYMDERGKKMWRIVCDILRNKEIYLESVADEVTTDVAER